MKYFTLFSFLAALFLMISCGKDEAPKDIDLTIGLVAWFPLDGTAFDTINSIQGQLHSVNTTNDRHGNSNRAMLFKAVDSSFIDFGDHAAYSFPQNIFSISCWIRCTDTSGKRGALSKRGQYGPFEYSLDNYLSPPDFSLDNWVANGGTTVYGVDPLNAVVPVQLNEWQHLVFTADGTVLRCYLNGIQQPGTDSLHNQNSFEDTDAPLQIGVGGGYDKKYFFTGAIDDIRIYNRVLLSEEIQALSDL